jgi:hypothetical protein
MKEVDIKVKKSKKERGKMFPVLFLSEQKNALLG